MNIILTFIIGFIAGFIFQNPVSTNLSNMLCYFTKGFHRLGCLIITEFGCNFELMMLRIILKRQRPDLRTEDERMEEANSIIRKALAVDGKDPNDAKYFKFKRD